MLPAFAVIHFFPRNAFYDDAIGWKAQVVKPCAISSSSPGLRQATCRNGQAIDSILPSGHMNKGVYRGQWPDRL